MAKTINKAVVQEYFDEFEKTGGESYPKMKQVILSVVERQDRLEVLLGKLYQGLKQLAQEVRGADGTPITDPAQLAAEEAMDAAAGPRQGDAPPQAAPQRRNGGGPRIGADGTPITDPAQLAAEEMMDAATA